jgi:NTP pyrophosphatase (non-canonical NTP hydrolase)
MSEKFYKGLKIKDIQSLDTDNCVGYCKGEICFFENKKLSNTKEESLKLWKPVLLQEVINYHQIKFGKQDFMLQLDKLEEEVIELLGAIQRVKENKNVGDKDVLDTLMDYVQDEYGDVIMAGSELLNLPKAMEHTFDKLALRIYPDNFKHIEE